MIIYLESYGCTANLNNSEIIEGMLKDCVVMHSMPPKKQREIAIINTCIVKGPTLNRMELRIKQLCKFRHIIVTGCMANAYPERIKRLCSKAIIVTTNNIGSIPKIITGVYKKNHYSKIYNFVPLKKPKMLFNSVVGITQISEGCIGNCTYCATKLAKGVLRSFPKAGIIKNVKLDLSRGCKEIWLTSQDNAIYGLDKGNIQLVDLLKSITNINKKFWLRIGMMNPSHITYFIDGLIDIMQSEKIFKFLHLPVQSGSDKILRNMNRQYTVKQFISAVKKFKKRFPYGTLSTDIIVGCPNENNSDFKKSLQLIEKTKPNIVNVSRFWPMPGTKAGNLFKDMNKEEQEHVIMKSKKRAIILLKKSSEIGYNLNVRYVKDKNEQVECIVEKKGFKGTYLSRDINYKLIVINKKDTHNSRDIIGRFVDVKMQKATPRYILSRLEN